MHSTNWDNLRFVLSVANHGSVSAAARALGVNHATVLRRVAAFEEDHGGAVFEKTATGYRVLPDRAGVIEAAREVENSVLSVERLMHGARAPLRGLVRVSSTDSLCQMVLPPLLAQLRDFSSELQIEVMSTNSHLDFSRMQADISVRPADKLPDEMKGDTRARLAFRVYAAPGARKTWLALAGPLARSVAGTWMSQNVPPADIAAGADSFMVLQQMALAGMGSVLLPVFLGENTPGLERQSGPWPEISVPIWVATHAELRDVPRISIVREQILHYLGERAHLLDGST